MLLHYQELSADLERIRSYLTAPTSSTPTLDQRRFAYVACISALYASFENFAERIAFRFSQILLANATHLASDTLTRLRKRYVSNASTLLSQTLGSGRYQDVTELDVAKSLASCLDEATPYDLRLEVLSLHSANLRWSTLNDMFRWAVDDLLIGVSESDIIAKWANPAGASGKAIADTIEAELKELVSRRNEVAHRGIPDEILSPERMLGKISYIEVVALAMVASLAARVLDITKTNGDSVSLGIPSKLYKNDRVAVVTLDNHISQGEIVWAATRSKKVRWGRVLEVQLNDTTVSHAAAGQEAGLLLEFAMPDNSMLHHWRTPTEDLIPAPSEIFGDKGPL